MKRQITIILVMIFNFSYSQNLLYPIQLDRPDQTECPYITPENYLQAENGFNIENSDNENSIIVLPTILWKYGINNNLEIRMITESNIIKNKKKNSIGFLPIIFGFKTNLIKEKGKVPLTSFIFHLNTSKTGSEGFNTSYIAPSFRFTMQHTLSEKLTLAYNIGAEWDGESAKQTYIYTLTNGLSFSKKVGVYYEVYGFISSSKKNEHLFDCGVTYLANNYIMFDISGGSRIDNYKVNFISLGISYRFSTK